MNVLLTGGTGYIGSHTAVALARDGCHVILYDNLSNSSADVVHRVHKIVGRPVSFVQGDVRDQQRLEATLQEARVDAVVHLAGLKSVDQSINSPLDYYDVNVGGTITLLKAMAICGVRKLAFSSSATVYGSPQYIPIDEKHPINPISPYGSSKVCAEKALEDVARSDPSWRISVLRYFNPVGADQSGSLGDAPQGSPKNLVPTLARVATGELPFLPVYGADYPTYDGTGVRDYIHIEDLAAGHVAAIRARLAESFEVFNLGRGVGVSVLELVHCFEQTVGCHVPLRMLPRRNGDVASCYASAEKAKTHLGWKAERDLHLMCISSWKFEKQRVSNGEM